jgi:ribosomal protein S18 acetylase RimI-like enzyme
MTDNILCRAAGADDVDTVHALAKQFYAHFNYVFTPRHRELIKGFIATPYLGSLWLIESNQSVVGYAALTYGFSFEFGGRDAFVDELFVLDTCRGKGVGAAALQQLQSMATSLGLIAIHLQTESYNQRAKRLYESVGFNDLGRATLTWRP